MMLELTEDEVRTVISGLHYLAGEAMTQESADEADALRRKIEEMLES